MKNLINKKNQQTHKNFYRKETTKGKRTKILITKKMKPSEKIDITDLHNEKIAVINLKKAIEQAEMFKDMYLGNNPTTKANTERQTYWKHLYEQLLRLKSIK